MSETPRVVIQTRYRDISDEETKVHHAHMGESLPNNWENLRGRAIEIVTPAVESVSREIGCGQPWYRVVKPLIKTYNYVCPHIAEIGD